MSLSMSCSKYFAGIPYLNPSFEMEGGIAYCGVAQKEWGGVSGAAIIWIKTQSCSDGILLNHIRIRI